MKKNSVWFALLGFILIWAAIPASAGHREEELNFQKRYVDRIDQRTQDQSNSHRFGFRNGFAEEGFHPLLGEGFNSDVWVHTHTSGVFAYVGTWGFSGTAPSDGVVKVVDVTNPGDPELVNTLPPPPGTRTNDVKVHRMTVGPATGKDLLFVSNELTADSGHTGFQIWDVTDPTDATLLSTFRTAAGVHNLWPFTRPDLGKSFVALAVPFQPKGLFIVDVTNPEKPRLSAKFGIGEPLIGRINSEDQVNFIHDVTVQGEVAYVSWWDAGLVTVDLNDPARPKLLDRVDYSPADQGNTHFAQATMAGAQRIVVVGDEMFPPECPYGFTRLFDATDPANVQEDMVGAFDGQANMLDASDGTNDLHVFPDPNTGECLTNADYTMHNAWPIGSDVYISWYSNGIQRISIADPADPSQSAYYIHEGVEDPQEVLPTAPEFWGVAVDDRGLVYGSDMNAGLFILSVESAEPGSPKSTTFP